MDQLQAIVGQEGPFMALFVALLCILLGFGSKVVQPRYTKRSRKPFDPVVPFTSIAGISQSQGFDQAEQLRCVERAAFSRRPLLNRGEKRLFNIVEGACAREAPGWRVMAQVCLGEILASPQPEAFRAINAKRVDLLIVDNDANPLHAIEFQGTGHHLGPAATRDAIKKEALRRAGVGYHEVLTEDTPVQISALVARLAAKQAA